MLHHASKSFCSHSGSLPAMCDKIYVTLNCYFWLTVRLLLGTSQHNHSSSMDSNYSNYAIPNATQTPAHYHQLSSQSSTASAQPPPPTMKRQLSAGSNVPSHQTGVLEQLDKRVSVSSLSSSTGGIPSDREEPSQDSITMVSAKLIDYT